MSKTIEKQMKDNILFRHKYSSFDTWQKNDPDIQLNELIERIYIFEQDELPDLWTKEVIINTNKLTIAKGNTNNFRIKLSQNPDYDHEYFEDTEHTSGYIFMVKPHIMKQPRQIVKYVSCIIKIKNQQQILLSKRINKSKMMYGKYECPGGKVEPNESPIKAIIRELYEETGLFIKSLEFVNKEIFNMKDNSNVEINYYIAYLTDVYRTSERAPSYIDLSNEHSDYQWVNVEDVAMYDCVPLLKERTKDTLMPKLNQLT